MTDLSSTTDPHPPNIFSGGGLRDSNLEILGDRRSVSPTEPGSTFQKPDTVSTLDSAGTSATPTVTQPALGTDPQQSTALDRPNEDDDSKDDSKDDTMSEDGSESDTEMADAVSSFSEGPDNNVSPLTEHSQENDEDVLERIPYFFRLLDLVDEHGSGGIVEKIVIDQRSLHKLLNIVQPGSYDSVSKINFKALDKLSIKPTGLYGNRSEIVKFLQEAGYLDEASASFLSRAESPDGPASILRSGLYLALRHDQDHQVSSKSAFIIYWPEETTWDDQAASSSVRRNRVTFMRYLTKLADQIIALVSPAQAQAFVWETGARNKDLPEDQQENDDDARLFSFEVSKSVEQDEEAIASPGFTVSVDSRHLPRGGDTAKVELVPGEQKVALLVLKKEEARAENKPFEENISGMNLAKMIESNEYPLQLGKIQLDDLLLLASNGLREKYKGLFSTYDQRIQELERNRSVAEAEDKKFVEGKINQDRPKVTEEVQNIIRMLYDSIYPSLGLEFQVSHEPEVSAKLQQWYPGLLKVHDDIMKKLKLDVVNDKEFKVLKSKWIFIQDYLKQNPHLPEVEQDDFINDIINGEGEIIPEAKQATKGPSSGLKDWMASQLSRVIPFGGGPTQQPHHSAKNSSKHVKDPEFVAQLQSQKGLHRALLDLSQRIYSRLRHELDSLEKKVIRDYVDRVLSGERTRRAISASGARNSEFQDGRRRAFEDLFNNLKAAMGTNPQRACVVDWLRKTQLNSGRGHGYYSGGTTQFRWGGTRISLRPAQDRYSIYPLELTEQDSQMCRTDEAHVPQPKLETRHKFEFTVGEGHSVEFLHLVRDKCLVVVSEKGRTRIYIEDNVTLNQAINLSSGKITLNHDSLGGSRCLYAFDRATRLLAILHGQKDLKLSIYIFDEFFVNLRSRGSPISLKNWYDQSVDISKACFVPGLEEVCLIEASGRVRIFSLVTQLFRNAHLQIDRPIVNAFSAPDGSCLLVAVEGQNSSSPHGHRLLAFHWASFGMNKLGIDSSELSLSDAYRVATRFEGRGRIHVISFSKNLGKITSKALLVKQKATEFSFRSDREHSQNATVETFNNSLIDCHLEVWTRFPVVPAVARNTLSPIVRQSRKLTFASPIVLAQIEEYFSRMISTFENTTRKPMGGALSAILVSSTNKVGRNVEDVSEFRMGSFIVELLCLIPLHLAVTRENRFIPLKDGVWDPDYERSLLGADVPAIIDALSLGWYESLFQSYMATKPVRVVSSMGEQSVGKSYCLNHFADTSFAGSAMRTTEGVWLSCTPTESYLLVSLDFEGVHSIERSAQEDALLVLFNTAISNLVLFRNNFAMSRDIAGLFTSFQSSATVLDPNVNRGLFNSTLAIIIKDVTTADANDIVKEFSLKFQGIVETERDQNFISRLHRGRIQIIPWPVINSPNFYTLFLRLRQQLDKQNFTYNSAGAFLHNLKTLMAKIKTSDWGSLDQNLAAHRAQQLMERLPSALCYGRVDEGPLKNMDTDEELPTSDHMPSFFVPEFSSADVTESEASAEQALETLIQTCEPATDTRFRMTDGEYLEALQKCIYGALDERLALVQQWLTVNVERFPQGNQDVRNVIGKLNTAALAMRTAVRLCSAGCSSCQLLCLRTYRHSGEHSCGTNHRCVFDCEVAEGHDQTDEPCGLPAGHGGRHMCNVKAHSCGSECHLSKMGGCAQSCIKPLDHKGEHVCSARAHLCGKPCDLRNVKQGSYGGIYSCPGTCDAPWDEPHKQHACDNARSCPIECFLCRRLCCNTDHFHGLKSNAIHLCGQEHNCSSLCEADGICQIETRPSAIKEQFSGRHESFMYTRYTQVDKRLSCVIPIPPGELSHDGAHTHDTADDVFHYCEARCPNCEYLCSLPLGHPQQLHETSHGSMITTQWVLQPDEDDANPVYELQGRKFGSGDEGAPMLCNLVCAAQGRHAHIDYCRDPGNCDNTDCEHILERLHPDPNKPKDWVSHSTYWARSGFKDPYSNDEQIDFAKCDVLCAGPEHEATATAAANPSYCTLPIFHAPQPQQPAPPIGHVSMDGHSFGCQNPSRLHQAYHIVFVIDSSGSMTLGDRFPLPNTPVSARLVSQCNNRYGAVLSALYSFWISRDTATASSATQMRQDAYSVITFDHNANIRVQNDFASTTDQLVDQLIPQLGCGGTDFQQALGLAQSLIENNWSSDRAPVIVFLSDGECNIADNPVYDLCHLCVRLGKALAFYSVSFGVDASSASLRRMAEIAHEVYASAPQDVLSAARGNPCAYTNAIDSIQLADTFLGIAGSLQKPRASLMSQYGSSGRRAVY